MDKLIVTAGAVLFLGLMGIVGNMDLEDTLLKERHYIEMVCAGNWPDYKDLSPECEDKDDRDTQKEATQPLRSLYNKRGPSNQHKYLI